MKIKFYGVRGSIPVCGREFERYGGNTTCFRVHRPNANRIVIIDAGTGIRNLGKEIIKTGLSQNVINIIFSHFHWDHIQGFPFFSPAYNKNQTIGILVVGKDKNIQNLKEIFSRQMQKEFFPVELSAMGAKFEFLTLGDKETFYGADLIAMPQHHKYPGGSYAFRIQDETGSLVICTDIEHMNGLDENIIKLAQGADLLIHDGQYTPEEYPFYKGWGHSSWEMAAEVAIRAQVKKLIITHHDPDHSDDLLDSMEEKCKRVFPDSLFAKEGMEIEV